MNGFQYIAILLILIIISLVVIKLNKKECVSVNPLKAERNADAFLLCFGIFGYTKIPISNFCFDLYLC